MTRLLTILIEETIQAIKDGNPREAERKARRAALEAALMKRGTFGLDKKP